MLDVAAALIWKDDRFMICRRPLSDKNTRGGRWEFPGGKLENGESVKEALVRECREELSVTLVPGEVFAELEHDYGDIVIHLTIVNARIEEDEPHLNEHTGYAWISADELDSYELCDADRKAADRLRYVSSKAMHHGAPADDDTSVLRLQKERAVYDLLDSLGADFMRMDHMPLYTIEACDVIEGVLGTLICKNLFLCSRTKNDFYLLLMPGGKRFNTSVFSHEIGTSRLSFAPSEYMSEYLDVTPGSVTVMGLMNDSENKVKLYIDRDLLGEEYFACHPCINTATVVLKTSDLLEKVIPALGHTFTVVDL